MSNKDQSAKPARGQSHDSSDQSERDRGGDRSDKRHRGKRGRRTEQSVQRQPQRNRSSLNMDELHEITELFTAHGLTELEYENAEIHVRLSRNPPPTVFSGALAGSSNTATSTLPGVESGATQGSAAAAVTDASAASTGAAEAGQAPEVEEELHLITSPIVGTFYRSSSPSAEPFVRAGSKVEPDSIVCIIEAMKLMNEIQAETTGVVEKIYVENGQPVEYGQPLFGVKK
jgi:acetyl-CoA carboxylase biotin carboxyl carrier protein